jgi:hypothetical protein
MSSGKHLYPKPEYFGFFDPRHDSEGLSASFLASGLERFTHVLDVFGRAFLNGTFTSPFYNRGD